MSDEKPKYQHEFFRCPKCLSFGKMKMQYGNVVCIVCNELTIYSDAMSFTKAFDLGRKYQQKHPDEEIKK